MVWTHNQQLTVAVMQMAPRKLTARRSQRVSTHLKAISR